MSETSDIVTPTIKALEALGIKAWRVNSGGRVGRVKLAPSGMPDIMGILHPSGRLFGLEAKLPGKRATAIQEAWHADARSRGALVAVIHSATEAVGVVSEWRRQEPVVLHKPCTNGIYLGLTRSWDSTREAGMRLVEPAPTPVSKAKSPAPTATKKRSARASGKMGVGE